MPWLVSPFRYATDYYTRLGYIAMCSQAYWYQYLYLWLSAIFVIESGKTGLIHTSTEIQFLSISERYTHALPRNTKYLAIDGQVCFYRRLFADAVKPRRCMSWSWGALIGLHGVPNCSSRQSGPPLWIVPVHVTYWRHSTALWVRMGALPRLRLPTRPHPPTPYRINPWYYRSWKKNHQKTSSIQVACRNSYKMLAI